jgi:hypothetical protein
MDRPRVLGLMVLPASAAKRFPAAAAGYDDD